MAPEEGSFKGPYILESGHSIKVRSQSPWVRTFSSGAIQNSQPCLEDQTSLHKTTFPKAVSSRKSVRSSVKLIHR